ncbi:stage V sporulation protein AA [Caldibacillus lycopersici]|uniref:Stage V sporulation protein AA n=1 Tax=Perspicuibacillus lycopersici TaxID=1325689 RepID=A0AAE3IUQ4_9BACI|nr:stage V sporulation protein AA [Perspicuibacillus lycopersici]MCU9613761.1 stage V sporulation protein AA [Perspicuibacillus lycopersici]
MENTIYIRLRHRVEVKENERIRLKDVALIIAPENILPTLENLCIYEVTKEDKNTIIIDGMQVIKHITFQTNESEIQLIGPPQTIIEVVYKKSRLSFPIFLIVWFLLFIGSAFTIMNFHEDVSMQLVHQKLFYLLTGIKDSKPLVFQIPYSIGLGLGMILFFNHVFKKRINEEPSPLEVEMFNYQQAIDQYLVMHENKERMKKIHDR